MLTRGALALTFLLAIGQAAPGFAQSDSLRPAPAAEVLTGWAGFVDETLIEHVAFGGITRFYVTPRISLGPEVAYLRGPDGDRDVMITGNLTFDLLRPRLGRPRRVTPFLVVGGGFAQNSLLIGTISYTSNEGAFTGGGGVRVWFNDSIYGVVETRIGWEPHVRVMGGVGVALR